MFSVIVCSGGLFSGQNEKDPSMAQYAPWVESLGDSDRTRASLPSYGRRNSFSYSLCNIYTAQLHSGPQCCQDSNALKHIGILHAATIRMCSDSFSSHLHSFRRALHIARFYMRVATWLRVVVPHEHFSQ